MKKLFAVIIIVLSIYGCASKKDPATSPPGKYCIPDSIMNEITFDTVSYQPVVNEFSLIGKVTYDQDKVVKLYPLASGNVLEVKVALGDYVKAGQVLAIVKSTEITGAENDIVNAQSNLSVSEKNLEATTDMYKSGISSQREFLAAQKEVDKASSELNKTKTILSIYGGNQSDYIIKSPISGFIVEKFVNPNMQIRPDNTTNLFTISDLRKVWILASVFETEISNIKIGEKVTITTISYPGKTFTGSIDKIYNVLDPDNKTMKVRIQLENKDILLKPEMFADVMVHQVTDSSMLSVPAKSVVFDRNKYWVIIYKDKCEVHASQVDVVASTSSISYIRSDIKPGDKVVTNLQLLIYNALNQ
jgi:cobalt-zinc-cadmium efflux system membrane fusion protein